jgi:DNA-binding CsgD family transcriptional regulator
MSRLAPFSAALADLVPAVSSEAFAPRLVNLLRSVMAIDDATILLYPGTDLPQIVHSEVPEDTGASTLHVFLRGAFLLDPYSLAAGEGRFGVFRLKELAPSGFRDGEYYKTWYRNCGYQDEAGYLLPLPAGGFVNIALGKTGARTRFTRRDMDTLEAIRPAVEALCQQHWGGSHAAAADSGLREQLNSALAAFGSSLLTEREAQVINLVLHGHSTKTLADKLSISVETVKLHRKHAYAKLEVRSQAELFYLFLDSLMSARDYAGGDTLEPYMRRPDSRPGERR